MPIEIFVLALRVMNVVKQIFLLVLALVVFTTSSCFAVDVHMCKGNVKSQAFFRSAVACDQMSEIEKEEPFRASLSKSTAASVCAWLTGLKFSPACFTT